MERKKPTQNTKIDIDQTKNITKEMSYFLGLLWTDGYINSKNGYSVFVKLISDDLLELTHIIDNIGKYACYKAEPVGRKPTLTIAFFSKDFYNFLKDLDYDKKSKSSADKVLSIIPENLKKYFFRGIIDGDGHISFRDRLSYVLTICSTYEQDWTYMQKTYDKFDIKYSIKRVDRTNGRSSAINVYNYTDILKFLRYVYDGYEADRIGLPRKYDKYKLFLNKSKMTN